MIDEIKEASVESSMNFGDTLDMGITDDPEGLKYLMSMLTNLYSDPELAVIREYYTNALDAHAEIGQDKPVDVYLPTRENPLYVVKDYGVGMSREDIDKIYRLYGASTKRKSNASVGHFGLGCKSALTIATQFTLTSIKDGLKTTAIIGKDESGVNKVDILPVRPTDEVSGTTVTIPVPDVKSFTDKLTAFFKYSNPDKVLLNGKRPENIYEKSTLLAMPGIDAKVYTRNVERINFWAKEPVTFHLVMGSVPYEITRDNVREALDRTGQKMDIASSDISVVFAIGIGDVNLTPNREGLRYTDKTKAFVDKLLDVYVTSIRESAQKEIDAVQDRSEVFEVVSKWQSVFPYSKPKWQGVEIQYGIALTELYPIVDRGIETASHSKTDRISTQNDKTVVEGVDPKEYRKISQWLGSYLAATDSSKTDFLLVPDLATAGLNNPWVTENSKFTIVQAADLVAKAKEYRKEQRALNRVKDEKPVNRQTYPVLDMKTGSVSYVPYDQIEEGLPYIDQAQYIQGSKVHDWADHPNYNMIIVGNIVKNLKLVTSAPKIIVVQKPRKASALEKRVPGSYNIDKHFEELLREYKKHPRKMSLRDYVTASKSGSDFKALMLNLKKLGLHTQVPDADLRRMLNPKRSDVLTYQQLKETTDVLKWYAPSYITREVSETMSTDLFNRLHARYPLVKALYVPSTNTKGLAHVALYLKAAAEHDRELLSTP